jgi:uncharacterized protein involved in exopolysaccharide biosynthesis
MENNNIDRREEEIDIVELVKSLWSRRRFIAKVTGMVVLLGLVAAIFGETKFTAKSVIVPQTGQKASGGNLLGLAAMAGINLNADQQGELLSPMVYPMVVSSVPFQKELMDSKITVGGHDGQVTLLDYFTEPGHRKFSLFPFLKRYTLGLPAVVLGAVRGGRDDASGADPLPDGMKALTRNESECMKVLAKLVSVTVNEKSGYISISATMPEALMSAQVAARAQELLQEYVTRFKLQKVQANLDFVEARDEEVRADFEAKQRALAAFQDANRDIASAVARTRESRLSNEYDLAFSIYSEMARQREQASIKVKEDTPIFTVVEPVTVPMEKSAPKRAFILAVSFFLGLFAACGLVLVLPWLANTFDPEWLNGWRSRLENAIK